MGNPLSYEGQDELKRQSADLARDFGKIQEASSDGYYAAMDAIHEELKSALVRQDWKCVSSLVKIGRALLKDQETALGS